MDDSTLHFARPVWLYAGAAGCVLMAWLFVVFDRRREAALTRLAHPRFRHRLMPGFSKALQRTKRVLWLLAVLLLCVAAAGPRMGYEWREVKRRGIDILFAVDTSRSMLAEDLTPNRLERARMGIHDFIERLEGDRVGLIPFAGSSYALCPLTLDYDAFRESLDALDTDLIPRQGTDVASAIREAERLFEEHGNNRRILVLITDGEDLQGDAIEAAESAAKNGMSIYPVGVGSTEGAVIPIVLPEGGKDFVRDDSGNPVRTKLDEATLKKIAEVTSGLYAQLGRGAEGLDTIYREKLRLVPKSEMDQRMEKVPLERFEWPLAAALVLLLMEFLLPDRRREAKARALPSVARRHPAATVAVPVIAVMLLAISVQLSRAEDPADARVLYNQGTTEFKAGDFKKAAETLRSSLNTPDLKLQNRVYYNLGNSLYRIGQTTMEESPDETIKTWEEAIKAYGDALALDSTDEDARYNQELAKRKLEELKKRLQEQKKDEEQSKDEQKDQQQKDEQKKQQQQKDGQKDQEQPNGEKKEGDQKPDDESADEKKPEEKDGGQKDQQEPKAGEPQKSEQKDQQMKSDEQKKQEGQQKPDGQKSGDESQKEHDQQKDGQKGQEQPNGEKKEADQKPDDKSADEKQSEKPAGEKKPEEKDGEKDQNAEPTGKKAQKEQQGKEDGKKEQPQPGAEGKKKAEGKEAEPKVAGKEKPVDAAEAGKETAFKEGEPAAISEERRTPGEMTPAEARQLLKALRSDERIVIPLEKPRDPRRFRDPNNTTKGKTW